MAGIKVGLIGGSGLGEAMLARGGMRHAMTTPFGRPSDDIIETSLNGIDMFFLARHGPGHIYSPTQVPFRANIFALKQLGVTHIIASGAVGALREEMKPRDLVIPDQIIDKTCRRQGTFFESVAVHAEFAEPFCPVLRQMLVEAAESESSKGYNVHARGCYVCMEGPAFSTRAESLMHRLWGGDLIGMTAMPEARLAREAEISYALIALVTDYDCWRQPAASDGVGADPQALLQEIIANLKHASDNALALLQAVLPRLAERSDELLAAPAQSALKHAIWTDKQRIPRDEIERLAPLWSKYFGA